MPRRPGPKRRGPRSGIERPANDELLVVVGPTASGKTELAMRLAEALRRRDRRRRQRADLPRLRRRARASPRAEERARAPHHLVDVRRPRRAVRRRSASPSSPTRPSPTSARRGRVPIVCGGAFLWVRALVLGLGSGAAGRCRTIRGPARGARRERRRAALHAELAARRSASAGRLAPNDFVRVSRALEVHELTGRPQSAWHAEHGFRVARHRARSSASRANARRAHVRIEARARGVARARLDRRGARPPRRRLRGARAMGSVGYRQVSAHLDGGIEADKLADEIVRATRLFVRRQRTWLRDEPVLWTAL